MADEPQIPTPPENPFDTNGNGNGHTIENGGEEEQLPEGTPGVAAKAGKTFLVIAIVGGLILFLLFSIMGGDKKKEKVTEPQEIKLAPKPPEPAPLPVVEAPPITAPPILNPSLPEIPEPIEVPTSIKAMDPKEESAAKAQAQARLRSNMMLKDGGDTGVGSILGGSNTPAPPTDPNSQFAANLATTQAQRVEATRIGDLHRTIAQGRLIHATMESALNTDLPAPIRAIVSRDTYGEAGNTPLIPKGSRLIGQYNTTLQSGQTRVFVVWTRVIRPDGVDIAIGSPLVDAIGSAGVSGQIDTKFQQMFSRSLLSSVMNIAMAIGSDEIKGGTSSTTTSAEGSTTTTGDAATTATTNALNRLGSVTDSFMQRFINVQPTILIDQGTPVNVFVNKDLVFPGDLAGARIIN